MKVYGPKPVRPRPPRTKTTIEGGPSPPRTYNDPVGHIKNYPWTNIRPQAKPGLGGYTIGRHGFMEKTGGSSLSPSNRLPDGLDEIVGLRKRKMTAPEDAKRAVSPPNMVSPVPPKWRVSLFRTINIDIWSDISWWVRFWSRLLLGCKWRDGSQTATGNNGFGITF